MKDILPIKVQNFVNSYFELKLGNKIVACPYYRNSEKKKDLRALMGKGTPEEIETEAKIWEKAKKVDFTKMSTEQIREFLIDRNIGIDCSGFVAHTINYYYKLKNHKPVWSKIYTPRHGFLNWLKYKLRPVEKIGADLLTSHQNAIAIDLKDVRAGDVVRLKWKKRNSHHILLIYEVKRDIEGKVTKLVYKHSTPYYDKLNGVKTAEIIITDETLPLEKQKWTEVDEHGVNFTFEGYLVQPEDNGLRRLKVLENVLNN